MFCPSCGKETPAGSTYCLHCGSKISAPAYMPPAAPPQQKKGSYSPVALLLTVLGLVGGLAVVGIAVASYIVQQNRIENERRANYNEQVARNRNANYAAAAAAAGRRPSDANVYQREAPQSGDQSAQATIVNNTFPVAPRSYVYYTFRVEGEARVRGRFSASGGANDVEVFILDDDGFQNFKNGHRASTYYNSGGYVTVGTIDRTLGEGTYYLVFNNSAAMLTNKVVTADVKAFK
jgi:hypothetical protein